MSRRFAVAAAIAALFATAARADFDALVRAVRSQPGLHRVWTPGISLARLAVWMIHPSGVHDFQIAVFEGDARFDGRDFERLASTSEDTPMVRVHSNRTGEVALVWARPRGGDLVDFLVLAHDPGDNTVVVRAVIDGAMLAREVCDPRHAGHVARR